MADDRKTDAELQEVARAYCKLLNAIDWDDETLVCGLREGLNKFLSNAFLRRGRKHKYLQGDFVSPQAKAKIAAGDFTGLVYEHMVPKAQYIQRPCEDAARAGTIECDYIVDLLRRYWKIAVITTDENRLLAKSKMPDNWNTIDVHHRYRQAGVELMAWGPA